MGQWLPVATLLEVTYKNSWSFLASTQVSRAQLLFSPLKRAPLQHCIADEERPSPGDRGSESCAIMLCFLFLNIKWVAQRGLKDDN